MNKKQFKGLIKEIVSECLSEVDAMDTMMPKFSDTDTKVAGIGSRLTAAGAKPNRQVKALIAAMRREDLWALRNAIDAEIEASGKKIDPFDKPEPEPEVTPYKGPPPEDPNEPTDLSGLSDEDPLEQPEDEPVAPKKKR